MPNFNEFTFESSKNGSHIHAIKCIPDTPIKGVIQISHGIAEHVNRYREFMNFMASNGYLCVANDHLGHGGSISSDKSDKGEFNSSDGWNCVVKDMATLHDITCAEYPGVKYVVFGHSMGSFLTRTYLINYSDKFDMAILSGTGNQSKILITMGNLMADILVKKNGYSSDGSLLNKIAFGSYLNRIDNPRTEYDWLTRVDSVVDNYISDENCGFICKTGLYDDMMKGIKYITNVNNIKKMNLNKPVYFMSGKEDPVGDYGKGIEKAYKIFCDVGCKDVSMKLYEGGRHEMLNELNKEDVMNDILTWINERIK